MLFRSEKKNENDSIDFHFVVMVLLSVDETCSELNLNVSKSGRKGMKEDITKRFYEMKSDLKLILSNQQYVSTSAKVWTSQELFRNDRKLS